MQAAAQAVAEAAHCWGPPLFISTPSSRPDLKSCLSWCPSYRDWLCSPTNPCYRDNCLRRHQLPTCCEARDTLHWSHRGRPRVHLSLQGVLNGLQIHCALVGQVVEDVASVLSSPAPLLEPGGLGTADTSSGVRVGSGSSCWRPTAGLEGTADAEQKKCGQRHAGALILEAAFWAIVQACPPNTACPDGHSCGETVMCC